MEDEIARYLAALEREDCYHVDATLKESAHELTQRVFFIGENGAERGPYVRKLIDRNSGLGAAYERIFEAQQRGGRFKHIPTIFECYRHDDLLVVVMEFVNGETFQDRVYRLDPSPRLAADVFPPLCDAVTELHESFDPPLIHRDLKPSNVMLTDGGLTLIDFGIAREFKQGAETDTAQFGTRAFAPPEQFGFGQTTVRSDVYALGMLLYYCLTEKIPTAQVRDAKFREEGVPSCLRPVLVHATALDPGERYSGAGELKDAFLEAMAGLSDTRLSDNHRRATAIIAVSTTIVATAVICAFFATGMLGQPHDEAGSAESPEPPGSPTAAQLSEALENSTGSDAQPSAAATEEATEAAVLDDLQTSAPQRNGFDPATNITAQIAGVRFQIPSYFGARTEQGEGTVRYYYAESGSSLAMIMTADSTLSADSTDDVKEAKDSYLAGLIESNGELFGEVVSSTDCSLAGHAARIVTLKGTMQGRAMTTKAVYFINQDVQEDAKVVGTIIFGQTDNVQLDCSTDFAKTIASAIPA